MRDEKKNSSDCGEGEKTRQREEIDDNLKTKSHTHTHAHTHILKVVTLISHLLAPHRSDWCSDAVLVRVDIEFK